MYPYTSGCQSQAAGFQNGAPVKPHLHWRRLGSHQLQFVIEMSIFMRNTQHVLLVCMHDNQRVLSTKNNGNCNLDIGTKNSYHCGEPRLKSLFVKS